MDKTYFPLAPFVGAYQMKAMTEEITLVAPDPNTVSMFGDEAPEASKGAYQVLARKYRPQTFDDLIGQEAMVRTLTHAFERGRIAHAYMLTGVRGVGKTTTARLLARAITYERDGVDGASMDLSIEGVHCRDIIEGRHMDVLEMDAASHTKVDEMRELIDGVRYAPVSARAKVYIIDEVHMLSDKAFNALLKTLEEPPPHVKFIFATTEIRKVPVTILSRCQRFDLKRVPPDRLAEHLTRICTREKVSVDADGLALIARAAEGSVRDSLSLLDQALVQAEGGASVSALMVRDMLGLADRGQTIGLLSHILKGQTGDALHGFAELYAAGADPAVVMRDLLDHTHGAALAKMLGRDTLVGPQDQVAELTELGSSCTASTLSRLWQMLLKAHEDVRTAPDPRAAADMAIIRLCHAADMPSPEDALKKLMTGDSVGGTGPSAPRGGGGGGATAVAYAAQPMMLAPQIATFNDVVAMAEARRDIRLKHDMEHYVRLAHFKNGAIGFCPADGAPADLSHRMAARLKDWTGQTWLIATEAEGGETIAESRDQAREAAMSDIRQQPLIADILRAFPKAEILSVRAPAAVVETMEPEPEEDF